MDKRVSLVTLGCRDVPRARAFYEAIGWSGPTVIGDHTVFWQAGGMVFGLWKRDEMNQATRLEDDGGYGGVMLAYNVGSPEEVDAVMAEVERAGGRVTAPPETAFWGGYTGVFADPEGHAWEVAHNPGWTLNEDGSISLGD
jgi:hypothetical protein